MQKPTIYEEDMKKKNTSKKYCYVKEEKELQKEIEDILESLDPPYTKKVEITTTEKKIKTYIMRKEKDSIITYQQERIPLKDILSIKRIS